VPDSWDLIVIGGGAAGLGAARAGAAGGARVLLVSEGEIGGECTFTGCVPSKTLIEAAARGTVFPAAMRAVRHAVAAIAAAETPDVLAREGIEVLRGRAVFTSPHEVSVGGRALRARAFVVATGSQPSVPPVPGLAGTGYLTNETIFGPGELLGELPGRLAVLGGGPVGCELAQAFARLGSHVTVIEAAPRLLPTADPDASRVVAEVFGAEGISVRTGVAAASVKHDKKAVELALVRLPIVTGV
jgi:pyruvate/2-oxoglutarate dehydrogenase complex dihydrolipoamide dehydrogenase (E3) component